MILHYDDMMTLCWSLPYEDLMLNANIIFSFHDLISTCPYVMLGRSYLENS